MRLSSLLASTVLAAGLAAFASPAFAGPTPINFTWNPSGVGLVGTQFTANNFNVTDFATITVTNSPSVGDFTETGALNVPLFLNGGSPFIPAGLGSTYSLYYTFTASGNQGGAIPPVGQSVTGSFSSLDYVLWATPHSTPNFTVGAGGVTITGNGGAFALATGSMVGGSAANTLTLSNTSNGLSPTANVEVTLDVCTGAGGACTIDASNFFVTPPATATVLQFGNFSANVGVATLHGNQVWINGGGGNITESVVVPEPFTLSIFGAGLAGAAALRRRKAKKA